MKRLLQRFSKLSLLFVFALFFFTGVQAVDKHEFVVVLDAGHGGKDPGAVNGKTYEKDITLNIVLTLGELIEKNRPNVKVLYTRKKDVYLTLQERADIANKSNSDLFISIHVNANNKGSAYGTETYTLGLTKSKSNLDVAMRENAVILLEDDYKVKYAGFDPNSPDSYIMFECIQDRFFEKSVNFASTVQNSFAKKGRKDRGVRQAGFWVLHKTAMPSVLIEVGFLSNSNEKNFLVSKNGQKEMAKAIYDSFDGFVADYEKKSGMQNHMISNKITKKETPEEKIEKKVEAKEIVVEKPIEKEQIVKQEVAVSTMTKEEEAKSQQFLDKMRAEAKFKKERDAELRSKNKVPEEAKEIVVEKLLQVEEKPLSLPARVHLNNGVVFKLQLFALSVKKPLDDPSFKGLKVDYYREGGMYKYTHGNTNDFEEIKRLKRQISSKFPALIVAFKNGERIPLREALNR